MIWISRNLWRIEMVLYIDVYLITHLVGICSENLTHRLENTRIVFRLKKYTNNEYDVIC